MRVFEVALRSPSFATVYYCTITEDRNKCFLNLRRVVLGWSGAHGWRGAIGIQGSALLRVHQVANMLPKVDKEVDDLH
jgi:hypothetical protein